MELDELLKTLTHRAVYLDTDSYLQELQLHLNDMDIRPNSGDETTPIFRDARKVLEWHIAQPWTRSAESWDRLGTALFWLEWGIGNVADPLLAGRTGQAYGQALRIDPTFALTYLNLANVLAQTRNPPFSDAQVEGMYQLALRVFGRHHAAICDVVYYLLSFAAHSDEMYDRYRLAFGDLIQQTVTREDSAGSGCWSAPHFTSDVLIAIQLAGIEYLSNGGSLFRHPLPIGIFDDITGRPCRVYLEWRCEEGGIEIIGFLIEPRPHRNGPAPWESLSASGSTRT